MDKKTRKEETNKQTNKQTNKSKVAKVEAPRHDNHTSRSPVL
jgi:hypothetical protein